MEKMEQTRADCNPECMDETLNDLKSYVARAAQQGVAAHEIEADVWRQVLRLGRQAMQLLFDLVGPGDVGETPELPDGPQVRRLDGLHRCVYQSILGRFEVERTVYCSRQGQKIEYVPFDTQLQLPEGDLLHNGAFATPLCRFISSETERLELVNSQLAAVQKTVFLSIDQ
jgi:hypothetical protein